VATKKVFSFVIINFSRSGILTNQQAAYNKVLCLGEAGAGKKGTEWATNYVLLQPMLLK